MFGQANACDAFLRDASSSGAHRADELRSPDRTVIFALIVDFGFTVALRAKGGCDDRRGLRINACNQQRLGTVAGPLFAHRAREQQKSVICGYYGIAKIIVCKKPINLTSFGDGNERHKVLAKCSGRRFTILFNGRIQHSPTHFASPRRLSYAFNLGIHSFYLWRRNRSIIVTLVAWSGLFGHVARGSRDAAGAYVEHPGRGATGAVWIGGQFNRHRMDSASGTIGIAFIPLKDALRIRDRPIR